MSKIPDEKHPYQLVVEGKEVHVFTNLILRSVDHLEEVRARLPLIRDAGGIDRAYKEFRALVRSQNYSVVGLVIDADDSVQQRWDAVRSLLQGLGLPAPTVCPPEGWVQTTGAGVRVGVWVMPNNVDPGKLETFLAALVPQEDAVWPWAREATEGARSRGAGFPEKDRIKAEIHAWLAWQEEPGKPFGTSVKAGYFRHDAPEAQAWLGWFRRLFLE